MIKTRTEVLAVDYKDYYRTLGVAGNASADDIKTAYRRLVRQYHPDISRAHDASRITQEINEAYAVLGDVNRRAAHDAQAARAAGAAWPRHRAAGFGASAFGPGDFFFSLFGYMARRPGGMVRRGPDMRADVRVSLHDLYHGATRQVAVRYATRDAFGQPRAAIRHIAVAIPKGSIPGHRLRVAGQGQPGSGGGPPGDLLLDIQIEPDERFRLSGRDVFASLAVTPWEAALGGPVDMHAPWGQLIVTLPPGMQGGRQLRLGGCGIPGYPAGDLYLELHIVLPPADTEQARALYQAMAREMPFNPRTGVRA